MKRLLWLLIVLQLFALAGCAAKVEGGSMSLSTDQAKQASWSIEVDPVEEAN